MVFSDRSYFTRYHLAWFPLCFTQEVTVRGKDWLTGYLIINTKDSKLVETVLREMKASPSFTGRKPETSAEDIANDDIITENPK